MDNRIYFALFSLLFAASGLFGTPPQSAFGLEGLELERRERRLFIDDEEIDRMEGLERVVHQPVKHPQNPVLKREHPWEEFRVQVYGTVLFDPIERSFKAWYMNIPKTAAEKITVQGKSRPGHATLLSYATSHDGVSWNKPSLGLVDYEGSTDNNMIAPDLYNPEGFSVLFEPLDPDPEKRYKAFYWDHGFGPLVMHEGNEIYGSGDKDGMHVAFSPDGIDWNPYEGNPVMEQGSDTGQVVLFDPNLKKYVAFGRFGAGGRKVARVESEDFIHWSEPSLVLEPDETDGPQTQFYGISIDLYEGLYIGVLWMFWIDEGNVGRIDFQLCHSRDGIEWKRDPNRSVFLPNGPKGAWDSGDMRAACRSVILEKEVRFYYSGSAAPHGRGAELNLGMDIGLATLRRDGWVSLSAGADAGMVRTKPFVCPGGKLSLNIDAEGGSVSVRILDEEGRPIRGLYPTDPLADDSLHLRVNIDETVFWDLKGKAIALQFILKDADLYSFWFE